MKEILLVRLALEPFCLQYDTAQHLHPRLVASPLELRCSLHLHRSKSSMVRIQ